MKVIFASVMLMVVLIGVPTSASAQTNSNEAAYRDYLLQVIALLQQQLVVLQGQVKPAAPADFTSFLIEDESDVVAQYALPLQNQSRIPAAYRMHTERFVSLVPDQFHEYLKEIIFFDAADYEFDAFVETIPPYQDDTWRIGLNIDLTDESPTADNITELYVHEFAHIASYDSVGNQTNEYTEACHEYWEDFGCPPENSYLAEFTDRFWDDTTLDLVANGESLKESLGQRIFARTFVSSYAGMSPAEDFAESFAVFVLEPTPTGTSIRDEKVRFFSEFSELRAWRTEMLRNR